MWRSEDVPTSKTSRPTPNAFRITIGLAMGLKSARSIPQHGPIIYRNQPVRKTVYEHRTRSKPYLIHRNSRTQIRADAAAGNRHVEIRACLEGIPGQCTQLHDRA